MQMINIRGELGLGRRRVFTKAVSPRMRGMLAIAELVGFNNAFIEPTNDFFLEAEKYTGLVQTLRAKYPVGILFDKGHDYQIRRILFPNSAKVKAENTTNLIAQMQSNNKPIVTSEVRKLTNEWVTAAKSEIEFLEFARGFYLQGLEYVEGSNMLIGMTVRELEDVKTRIGATHDGFKQSCDNLDKELKFMHAEHMFLSAQYTVDEFGNRIKKNPSIKEVQDILGKNNTLSVLRYFLTRLWILEFYSRGP